MAIDFSCTSCGQSYRVKEEFAGRSTKCKKCGGPILIPTPAPPEPEPLSSDAWFDEELSVPAPAPKPVAPAAPIASPSRASAPARPVPKSKVTFSLPSFGNSTIGRLGLGVLLSCVGALLGALVWAAVAVTTGYQLGIIAWGVGLAAGGGMAIGCGDEDGTLSGILAAVAALGGIVLAKIFIVMWVLASFSAEIRQEIVAGRLADEAFEKRGVNVETVSEEDYEAEYAKASEAIAGLSDEELDRVYSESLSRMAAAQDLSKGQPEPSAAAESTQPRSETNTPRVKIKINDEQGPSLASAFFQSMFRPIDGFFILLAFASAYKLGSGFGG